MLQVEDMLSTAVSAYSLNHHAHPTPADFPSLAKLSLACCPSPWPASVCTCKQGGAGSEKTAAHGAECSIAQVSTATTN